VNRKNLFLKTDINTVGDLAYEV